MNESIRPLAVLALLIALLLGGCAQRAEAAPPLKGASMGGPFTLTDQNGRRVSDRDFAGKYRLVYFGYTFCPDVCPIDMRDAGRRPAPVRGERRRRARRGSSRSSSPSIRRATRPQVLRRFVAAFHPAPHRPHRQRGRDRPGRPRATASIYEREPADAGGGYNVNHSAHGGALRPGRRADRDPAAARPSAGRAPRGSPPSSSAGCDEGALLGTAARALDREEWEALVRRLRQMLPAQARGRSDRRALPDQRRLPPARPDQLPLLRLQAPPRLRARLRAARCAQRSHEIDWLPSTCAYRLRAEGKPLEPTGII